MNICLKYLLTIIISAHSCADVVSAALVPVKPFPDPPESSPTLEIEEFVPQDGKFASPFAVYKNHLYVYPKNLKYDSQKVFAKVCMICKCSNALIVFLALFKWVELDMLLLLLKKATGRI